MRIPLFLAVAQWTLLLALGLLVIVMYRQLARVMGGTGPTEAGPALGSRAASFRYARPGDDAVRYFTPGDGQAALLAFVDPTCLACEKLVAALGEARRAGDLDGLRVLLVTSEPPGYLQISEDFRTTALEIGRPVTRTELNSYNASATPLLVAIDPTGLVRLAGHAMRPADVRAFIQACLLPPPEASLGVLRTHGAARPEPAARFPTAE